MPRCQSRQTATRPPVKNVRGTLQRRSANRRTLAAENGASKASSPDVSSHVSAGAAGEAFLVEGTVIEAAGDELGAGSSASPQLADSAPFAEIKSGAAPSGVAVLVPLQLGVGDEGAGREEETATTAEVALASLVVGVGTGGEPGRCLNVAEAAGAAVGIARGHTHGAMRPWARATT